MGLPNGLILVSGPFVIGSEILMVLVLITLATYMVRDVRVQTAKSFFFCVEQWIRKVLSLVADFLRYESLISEGGPHKKENWPRDS